MTLKEKTNKLSASSNRLKPSKLWGHRGFFVFFGIVVKSGAGFDS